MYLYTRIFYSYPRIVGNLKKSCEHLVLREVTDKSSYFFLLGLLPRLTDCIDYGTFLSVIFFLNIRPSQLINVENMCKFMFFKYFV